MYLWSEKLFKCMTIGFKDGCIVHMLWTYNTFRESAASLYYMDLLVYPVRNWILNDS